MKNNTTRAHGRCLGGFLSDWHIVRCALEGGATSFVINLHARRDGVGCRKLGILIYYPFDLVKSDAVIAAVVEAGGTGGLMAGHLLGNFKLAAVLQVSGNAGGPEAMAAYSGRNASGQRTPLNHQMNICLGKRLPTLKLAVAHGRE